MFERKSYTWDILEKNNHILGYAFDLKLYQGYPRISLLKQDKIRDNPGSFFAAPGGLPAAAGLRTPLGPGTMPVDLITSDLGLGHGKPPEVLMPVLPSISMVLIEGSTGMRLHRLGRQVPSHWQRLGTQARP